ncbi:ATP-binding protein [Albimonas sp. CAU 1670]|uniref:hybrid sensor histidine kinase/response regulator n=1 Tax=Albimonas sp. CAU 1670 TaxID=3032599 RepID=UPI0023D99E4A|nr:ATP-binding protein [Albimonas sp. CAU 1670]MDF2232316.1 ATP-binding protein [Albimonas sp. CAU 1670]
MRSNSARARRWLDVLPASIATAAVAIFGVMVWQASVDFRATRELEESRAAIVEGAVSWLAHQAEIEMLRLSDFVARQDRDGASPPVAVPGAPAIPDDVALQYDIMWSRLDLLTTESFTSRARVARDGAAHITHLDAMIEALRTLDARLGLAPGAPPPADPYPSTEAALGAMVDFVHAWVEPLRRMGRAVYDDELRLRPQLFQALGELRERQRRQQIRFAALALGTGLAAALALRFVLRLARRLLAARAQFDAALGASSNAIAFFDETGRLATCNDEFRALHAVAGIPWAAGRTAREHFAAVAPHAPEARADPEAWIAAEAAPYAPVPAASTLGRFRDRRLQVRADGRKLLVESGRPTGGGYVITVADVTDLVAARDKAEALSAERSEMLAVIGHELRTPIAALVGALDLAAEASAEGAPAEDEDKDETGLRKHLSNATQAAEVIATMSEDVFEFAAVSGGTLEGRPQDFDLHDLFEAVCQATAPRAQARGLAFRAELGALRGAWVRADRVRLRQVAENLLTNALKFTRHGHVALRAFLSDPEPDGRRRLMVEVEDSGPGVPPEARALIFEPFRQHWGAARRPAGERGTGERAAGAWSPPAPLLAPPAAAPGRSPSAERRTATRGLGLGLAICRRILAGMGGEIDHRPRPGGGSVFWFAARLEPARRPAPRPRASAATLDGRGVSVLLVEDDPLLSEVTLAQLSRAGFAADHADSVATASAAGAARAYDLVLLDLQLPDGTGADVARALRAAPGGSRDSLIVALTAYADEEVKAEVRAQGIDHILKKPLAPERIAAILHENRGRPDAEAPHETRPDAEEALP